MSKKVRITQLKSIIRVLPEQRVNLAALGLRGIGKTKEHTLTPAIEGMIRKVRHMVKVEEI
jgi:large subunit ribosomal protein L30